MDKIECIQTFVRVSELGSFTAVAMERDVTQSSISKKVAWLEANLAITLINRTSRKLSLTEAGHAYYSYCKRMLEEQQEVEAQLLAEAVQVQGSLKVSMPTSLGLRLLALPLSEFMLTNPKLKLDLSLNDKQSDLIQDDVDVAIRVANLQDSTLKARYLMDNRVVFVASREYLDQYQAPQQLQDLKKHRYIRYSFMPSKWSIGRVGGGREEVSLEPTLSTDSAEMMLKMTMLGHGITALPHWMVAKELEKGELIALFTHLEPMTLPMYAVYKNTHRTPLKVRVFIDFLVEALNNQPQLD
ncbi:LysR family transcriptional regulator [Vibrio sp. SCSIO 43135]|uniref:LysR family transcriptional regulator n=1 Tax=Vibrio sp. SCSIO 43135 TaxID=2819096 RepID=UPI002074AF46|nr:LysR family transcriptional regulator [Vibrio sp. SCSIO 43135]USD43250.1 LysR family transcriptional regulator [Vibrio sp. SCSIO 43135]